MPKAPPPPLLPVSPCCYPHPSSDIIPPEGPTDHQDGPDNPTVDAYFDLLSAIPPRFDEPAPILLERRGVTRQPSETPRTTGPEGWQLEFWAKQTAYKNSVAAKLREAGQVTLAEGLEDCHSTFTVAKCNDCGATRSFPNRCDRFYCPECQPRLSADRRKAVEWWAKLVAQPKHVVLTVRNVPDLHPGHVAELKKWFQRLRHRKFTANWLGGFYSIELTNEGRGWHLHIHALIDAKWIDSAELARQWDSVTNHAGNIVKVKDARRQDYLAEVTKYAVKGVQLAKWTPDQIAEFIHAFEGQRTFGVFGSLYGARTEFADFIATLRDAKPLCDCGSCNVTYFTEAQWLTRDLHTAPTTRPRPPSPPQFNLNIPQPQDTRALYPH